MFGARGNASNLPITPSCRSAVASLIGRRMAFAKTWVNEPLSFTPAKPRDEEPVQRPWPIPRHRKARMGPHRARCRYGLRQFAQFVRRYRIGHELRACRCHPVQLPFAFTRFQRADAVDKHSTRNEAVCGRADERALQLDAARDALGAPMPEHFGMAAERAGR